MDLELQILHHYNTDALGGVLSIFFDRDKGGNAHNPWVEQLTPIFGMAMDTTGTGGSISMQAFID